MVSASRCPRKRRASKTLPPRSVLAPPVGRMLTQRQGLAPSAPLRVSASQSRSRPHSRPWIGSGARWPLSSERLRRTAATSNSLTTACCGSTSSSVRHRPAALRACSREGTPEQFIRTHRHGSLPGICLPARRPCPLNAEPALLDPAEKQKRTRCASPSSPGTLAHKGPTPLVPYSL